tara:strand:+ start:75 stop:518 length:444 start_codon:yes stop_codon:yes gene_type:complete
MSVTITKKEVFKLNKNLRMHKVLNDIADVFVKDIKNGIENLSEDINGVGFTPLSTFTKNYKNKKGYSYPSKPLYAEGKMKNVYVKQRATQTKKEAIVASNERDRAGIGAKHQEGKDVPQRQWFGISKRTNKPITKVARHHIKKALMK